jgi:hypothetical protein
MRIMAPRPNIKPGDWIRIAATDAVISIVRPENDPFGDCEVVFDPSKPTNTDVRWSGDKWEFVKRGDYGGCAEKYDRLRHYVWQLKRGRN